METEAQDTQGAGEFAGLPAAAPEPDNAAHEIETQHEQPQKSERDYAPKVDLSTLPDDIRQPLEARFRHLSGKMKRDTARLESKLQEWQQLAEEQSRHIEELRTVTTSVASQVHDRTFADTEAQLTQAAADAFQNGDMRGYQEANNKLTDLRVKKGIQEALAQREKPLKKEGRSIPAQRVEDVEIAPEVQAWQDEEDANGNALRPWAQPGSEGYFDALGHLTAIKANPRMQSYTETQIMQELDRRMGVTKTPARQNVMGANLTRGPKTAKVSLNPKAEEIAVRMKLGGPKATREQHIDAYRKQLTTSKGTRQ